MKTQPEAYYQRLFENAPIGIYRSTPEGNFIDANKALLSLLGYEDFRSLSTINIAELFVNPQARDEEQARLDRDGKVTSFEFQLRRKDGSIISVRDTASAVKNDCGEVIFYDGVLEDVTERVQAKAALLESHSRIEAEQAQRQLAENLREIANLISSSLEFEKVTQRIFRNLKRLIPFDSASLILEQNGQFTVAATSGFLQSEKLNNLRIDIQKDPLTQQVIETQLPLLLDNATDDPRFQNYSKSRSVKNWLAVPLITRHQVIGILTLDNSTPNAYREREIQVAFTLASQIAGALENARLFENERQKANIMSALHATLTDITAELDLKTLLAAILERATHLLNATGGELALFDAQKGIITIVACHNMTQDFTGKTMKPGHGAIGKVIVSGEPIIVRDYQTWEGHLRSAVDWPWKAVIAVPLIARDQIFGAIALADSKPDQNFDQADLYILSLFAQQAAIAIENAQLFKEIQQLAETDDLTGINNRRQLFVLGQREFDRAKRYGYPLSVIMLDIDNFKKINDTFGHAVGDVVLRRLAGMCQKNIREIDILGRYGGEEYVIVLPDTDLVQACEAAERLRSEAEGAQISSKVGALKITISLGVAQIDPGLPNLAALIDRADTALYQAKNAGKNQVAGWKKRNRNEVDPVFG
jgi:diguanylate cyclase (GGDEF)-like protein/PAS domain S-box-containing protein